MTDLPRQETEGRLNAHREILISLVAAAMTGQPSLRQVVEALEQEVNFRDGAEDPGLTPSAGYASGAEKSEEIRAILDMARQRAAAVDRIER